MGNNTSQLGGGRCVACGREIGGGGGEEVGPYW